MRRSRQSKSKSITNLIGLSFLLIVSVAAVFINDVKQYLNNMVHVIDSSEIKQHVKPYLNELSEIKEQVDSSIRRAKKIKESHSAKSHSLVQTESAASIKNIDTTITKAERAVKIIISKDAIAGTTGHVPSETAMTAFENTIDVVEPAIPVAENAIDVAAIPTDGNTIDVAAAVPRAQQIVDVKVPTAELTVDAAMSSGAASEEGITTSVSTVGPSSSPIQETIEIGDATQGDSDTVHRIQTYSHNDIVDAMEYFHTWYLRLLVWDGNEFSTYSLGHNSSTLYPEYVTSPRLTKIIPLLVHSLLHNFPDRFKQNSPVFEVLFSEADVIAINCGLTGLEPCPSSIPPILAFGSVYRDPSILPSAKAMPPAGRFSDCLYAYKLEGQTTCPLHHLAQKDLSFDELVPQLIWRGADWPFLPGLKEFEPLALRELMWKVPLQWNEQSKEEILGHIRDKDAELPPRWRAALYTLEADAAVEDTNEQSEGVLPWIDSRFVGGLQKDFREDLMKRGLRVNGDRIDENSMSRYKYQIDFGGGGGTSWEGTLSKLLAPGLLFHHETPTKDFFYDDIQPWVHYVPIGTDISDLRDKFMWAQSEKPETAAKIAREGTKFAEYMLSQEYMDRVYKELFVDHLGAIIDAFDSSHRLFYPLSMSVLHISKCTKGVCRTETGKDVFQSVRYSK